MPLVSSGACHYLNKFDQGSRHYKAVIVSNELTQEYLLSKAVSTSSLNRKINERGLGEPNSRAIHNTYIKRVFAVNKICDISYFCDTRFFTTARGKTRGFVTKNLCIILSLILVFEGHGKDYCGIALPLTQNRTSIENLNVPVCLQGNTVQYHYNVCHFRQNSHNRQPIT